MQCDSQSLQSDLDLLSKWSDEWLLRFNIDKYHVMHTDIKSKAKHYLEKGNNHLEVAESEVERDLGTWVSNNLKWESNVRRPLHMVCLFWA